MDGTLTPTPMRTRVAAGGVRDARLLQELQSDFQKLDLASVKGSMKQALAGAGGSGGGCSPEELARYGLTEELVNHIKGFTYVTFRHVLPLPTPPTPLGHPG